MVEATASTAPTIELRLQRAAQLFESLDPAPFREKSLDSAAHDYILQSALEHAPGAPLRLVLYLPRPSTRDEQGLAEAIHNHFRWQSEQARRMLRRRMRIGRISLLAGLALLAVCSLVRSTLPESLGGPVGFLGEGLLILGWVALWRPVEVLLFERWESHDERRWLQQLATVPVEISYHDDSAA